MSNALLESPKSNNEDSPSGLRLANDVRGYSTTPTAHVRDLVADGIKPYGLAVYFAIADRQRIAKGEYFRSNESLAEEAGISKSNVQKWLSILKKKQYVSVWYINGGRRMRVLTGVRRGTPTDTEGYSQEDPYKENNIKKTTQTEKCDVSFLTEKNRVLFGEGRVSKLVASYGLLKVQRGLLAWDSEEQSKIRNPMGWLIRAIKDDYEPRKATTNGQHFTEDTFEHHRIVSEYNGSSKENARTVKKLTEEGLTEARIAYRIWSKKI